MAKAKNTEPQHPSQMPFSELLSQFVSAGDGGMSPFSAGGISISPATSMTIKRSEEKKKRPQAAQDGGYEVEFFDDDEDMSQLTGVSGLDEIEPLVSDEDFDAWIEQAFIEDEDVTLRNNLISMGRKYAIKSMEEDGELSEVNKSFIRQEQAIHLIIEDIGADETAIGRDLEMLRAARTKSFKSLSDLASVKASLHNAKLAAIKELNAIEKAKYDIRLKLNKEKNEDAADSGMAATQAVQQLLSVGRKNLIGDDDGFEISGPSGYDPSVSYSDRSPESIIRLQADLPPATTDGDHFIDHEDDGVQLVLDISSEDGRKDIYAVDKAGNIVPNWPLPSKPDELRFQINEMAGEATDQLQRTYRLRRNGKDAGFDAQYSSSDE